MFQVFEVHLRSGQCFVLYNVISVIFYKDYIYFVTSDSEAFDYPLDEVVSFYCDLGNSED